MSDLLLQSWLRLSDGREHPLVGSCTLGRHPTNTLPLQGSEVSRRHAVIQAQGEAEFWIVDFGSANGTYVNGRRISRAVRLRNGDVIRIADVEIEFATEILSALHPAGKAVLASTMIRFDQADCWLMVVGIEGSTRLAQSMEPEEYPRLTGTWFKECRQIVQEHAGNMNQYLGDGFFCFWDSGNEERLRAALERLRGMQGAGSLPFHIILHHGNVAVGSVPTLGERSLHGAEVAFAFRMLDTAASQRQRVLLSEPAARLLGLPEEPVHAFQCALKGFEGLRSFFVPAPPRGA